MAKSEPKAVEKLSFEEAFAELETIVAALEAGDRPLDESMKLFERGQILTKHCAGLLDRADLKIKQLSGDTLTDLSEEA
jgi:exodeoxyribonuclease VII small subunit